MATPTTEPGCAAPFAPRGKPDVTHTGDPDPAGKRCGHERDCACHTCAIPPEVRAAEGDPEWCGERDCHRFMPETRRPNRSSRWRSETIAEFVDRTRRESGVPRHIEDPVTLHRLAVLFGFRAR